MIIIFKLIRRCRQHKQYKETVENTSRKSRNFAINLEEELKEYRNMNISRPGGFVREPETDNTTMVRQVLDISAIDDKINQNNHLIIEVHEEEIKNLGL